MKEFKLYHKNCKIKTGKNRYKYFQVTNWMKPGLFCLKCRKNVKYDEIIYNLEDMKDLTIEQYLGKLTK